MSVLAVLAVLFVQVLLAMLTWNAVVPKIFGLPGIGFVDAAMLTLLCDILFQSWADKIPAREKK